MKICIISEYAYSLGTTKSGTPGGAELQMTLLAKELVKRSYDVSFIVFVNKENIVKVIDGIN